MNRLTALVAAVALCALAGRPQLAHAIPDASVDVVAGVLAGAPPLPDVASDPFAAIASAEEDAVAGQWPAAVVIMLCLAGLALRKRTLPWKWAHTDQAHFWLSVIAGAVAALAQAIHRRGLHWMVLAYFIGGAILQACALAKATSSVAPSAEALKLFDLLPPKASPAAPPPVQAGYVRPWSLAICLALGLGAVGMLFYGCAALNQAVSQTEADCAPALEEQAPAVGTVVLASIEKQVQLGNAATSSEFATSLAPLLFQLGPSAWCLLYNGARHLIDDLQQQQVASIAGPVAAPCKLHRPRPEHRVYLQRVIDLALSKVPHKPPTK